MSTRLKKFLYVLLAVFVLMNVVAFNHAWKFTHFTGTDIPGTDHKNMSAAGLIKTAFFGIDNPRPARNWLPDRPYETIHIQSNEDLECWMIPAKNARGTVLMFHGYKDDKTGLLGRAYMLNDAGYNTMLVDMMGAGGSTGNRVTIGYDEAENVLDCYKYLEEKGEQKIVLFGISMGAAALMKATADHNLKPACIIAEAPFSTMRETVAIRFDMMGVPKFPMAHLLVIWGGLQHSFWGYNHNPSDYARQITSPTLIMFGGKDDRVKLSEEQDIINNLQGEKELIIYPEAGHVNFMGKYKDQWAEDITSFIGKSIAE